MNIQQSFGKGGIRRGLDGAPSQGRHPVSNRVHHPKSHGGVAGVDSQYDHNYLFRRKFVCPYYITPRKKGKALE